MPYLTSPVPPTIELYQLNATIAAGAPYTFRVRATDNVWLEDVNVTGAAATLIRQEGEEWVVELEPLASGVYEILVEATDISGNNATAGPLSLDVAAAEEPAEPRGDGGEEPSPGLLLVLVGIVAGLAMRGRARKP